MIKKTYLLNKPKRHLSRQQEPMDGTRWCHMLPMGLYVPSLSPNDKNVAGHLGISIFERTYAGLKIAKSSPVKPHGGANPGNLGIAPGTPNIGLGGPYKRKNWNRT